MSKNNNALPQIYIIRGPFAEGPSEKAYELNTQTGARIYWSGLYFVRPDGNFSYTPNESQNAMEFLLRRVKNYLASGLGKPLIIDGVHGAAEGEVIRIVAEAGAAWRFVFSAEDMPPTVKKL